MIKIVALLGDYWHSADDAKAGLQEALKHLSDSHTISVDYITHEEVSQAIDQYPDLIINAKMDEINPQDEEVITWLTEELDEKITSYVKEGGRILSWHAGMAAYSKDSNYIQMLHGYFTYHPPGLQDVTYIQNNKFSFPLKDEQYFVELDRENTDIDLWSKGVDGDSVAGWKHPFGKGKVCCFTPAHTREGMQNEHVSRLLAEKISWLLEE